jgi:hypothetical protein
VRAIGGATPAQALAFGTPGAIALFREVRFMQATPTRRAALPDALINWTTAAALITFGVVYVNDAAIMWRTILTLGLLSTANEILKIRASRIGTGTNYARIRLVLAVAYVGLALFGFFFPPPEP